MATLVTTYKNLLEKYFEDIK